MNARDVFGMNIDMVLPAFSEREEHVFEIDKAYKFDRDTTLTNPYTLYVVRGPDSVRARAFAAWAMTSWRHRLLGMKLSDGSAAFVSRSGGCT